MWGWVSRLAGEYKLEEELSLEQEYRLTEGWQ